MFLYSSTDTTWMCVNWREGRCSDTMSNFFRAKKSTRNTHFSEVYNRGVAAISRRTDSGFLLKACGPTWQLVAEGKAG